MFAKLADWFDHRTGCRQLVDALLIEEIPGGAKWRYVWGSCLAFVFTIQLVTGLVLMTAYSPGDTTAWGSVYFIQYQMEFGWLLRGIHHYGSQMMVVLLALHMLQVVIAGAHLPPREVNWWLGLGLLGAVLGMSLTGYLLPWDQKGYWATQVATNIAGTVPVVGGFIRKVVVGGPQYGHHTLTRFFALHVAVIPGLIIALIVAHLAVFRRHGVTHPRNAQGHGWFWPDQAFKDLAACLAIFGVLVYLAVFGGPEILGIHPANPIEAPEASAASGEPSEGWWQRMALAGRRGFGVNLDAPADPSGKYPARPEWYFLFLFQLLKHFEGDLEILGTIVIPKTVAIVLLLLPLLGYGRMRLFGHAVGLLVVLGLLGGAGYLTYQAIDEDHIDEATLALFDQVAGSSNPQAAQEELTAAERERLGKETVKKAYGFHQERKKATLAAARAVQLAANGIPADGAVQLLRRDPMTQGPVLFHKHCASCHDYAGQFTSPENRKDLKASDLAGFGTEEWILGLLRDASSERYFGRTDLSTMSGWKDNLDWDGILKERGEKKIEDELRQVTRFLASHPRPEAKRTKEDEIALDLMREPYGCLDCHGFEEPLEGAPSLAGYGGADWIRGMILSPDHPVRYGENNQMTIFLDLGGPAGAILRQEAERLGRSRIANLGSIERELIIRWLTGDDRLVFGGDPIAE